MSEATLGQCLSWCCGPHYKPYGVAYIPYVKIQGHRAVSYNKYLEVDSLGQYLDRMQSESNILAEPINCALQRLQQISD